MRHEQTKDIALFDSSERERTKVLRIVDAVPEPKPDCGEGSVKDFNREVMKKLDAADRAGKSRPAGLLKWRRDLEKRIFETGGTATFERGGTATPEQQCELACIKATYRLTRREGSSLPLVCGRKWSTDTAPAAVALEECLKALKNFDPAKGELGGYLYRIAYRGVRKAAWEMFGPGREMGFKGRQKADGTYSKPPRLLSIDATTKNGEGEVIDSALVAATATRDIPSCEVAPAELDSIFDLEVQHTVEYSDPTRMRTDAWASDIVKTQAVSVTSVGQEAIVAALELKLQNLSPEEQALLKRWKGIGDASDGEVLEELSILCLAAEYGISAEGMRKRLNKLLLKARLG